MCIQGEMWNLDLRFLLGSLLLLPILELFILLNYPTRELMVS